MLEDVIYGDITQRHVEDKSVGGNLRQRQETNGISTLAHGSQGQGSGSGRFIGFSLHQSIMACKYVNDYIFDISNKNYLLTNS